LSVKNENVNAAKKTRPQETVTEFKVKINKYGFIHLPKKSWKSLPFKNEEPLKAKIEGKTLVIQNA
jgi:hypothetical protein